jgi:hypothetical protein
MNFTFIIISVTDILGSIIPEAVSQLNLARSAGFTTDILFTPYRNNGATAQVNALMANIPNSLFRIIWVGVVSGNW